MLLLDNEPLNGSEVDVFGGGQLFRTLLPFLEAEGIRVRRIYDDGGTHGWAWDHVAYMEEGNQPPMLYCVGYQPGALQRLAQRGLRYRQLVQDGVRFGTFLSPQVTISPGCCIGNGSLIRSAAILDCRVHIGDCVYIGMGALVSHDGRIADNVFLGARSALAGEVTVASDAFIGVNATVIESVTIGSGALVAAGAVVTAPVEPRVLVAGVPARVKKRLEGLPAVEMVP